MNWKKTYLSYAVASHPLLAITQMILLDYFNLSEGAGSIFHVISVAAIMLPAIIIVFKIKTSLFIRVYFAVIILLAINSVLFSKNTPFMLTEALQFTLPIVIPCMFCILCVGDIRVFMQAVYKISWCFAVLLLFYVFLILTHRIVAENYSMYLGYASLLPMLVLYHKKTKYSLCAASSLLLYIIIWGNRGAAVAGLLYIFYDVTTIYGKKIVVVVGLAFSVLIASLESIVVFLSGYGIESRTINKMAYGGFDESEGREMVYTKMIKVLENNQAGIGLWGDRTYLDGSWSHNLILEVLLDFGVVLGCIILLFFFYRIIHTFVKCKLPERKLLFLFFCSSIIPLMLSNSYLRDYKFGIFLGVLFLLNRKRTISSRS